MKLSLVIAAYNVEPYLDECLGSIFGQSVLPERFEVILVNDGSKDGTGNVIEGWRQKHPLHIKSIHQENAGAAAARNAGMKIARGEWISFPDADDFLHKNYFANMLEEAAAAHPTPLLAIVANMVFFHERWRQFIDSHALRRRFMSGVVRKISSELGDHIQLSTSSVWLNRLLVLRNQIAFDPRVSPTFEDAHFLNRLFLLEPGKTVSFVPKAVYCYRKRASQDSTLDSAARKVGWYTSVIEFGLLQLVELARSKRGSVPQFIKNLLFYDVFWRVRHLADKPDALNFLSSEQKHKFETLMHLVFHHLDPKTILAFDFDGLTEAHRVALLGRFFDIERSQPRVFLNQFDQQLGMAQFIFYEHDDKSGSLQAFQDEAPVRHLFPKTIKKSFLGKPYLTERRFWVQVDPASKPRGGGTLTFRLGGADCSIRRGSIEIGTSVNAESIRKLYRPAQPTRMPEPLRQLREHVIRSRAKYRDAYVFIDRPEKADDNAEHLYRYVSRLKKGHNIWFALDRSSPDWSRLESEGFRLLEFGTKEHLAAHMNARFVLSSEATENVIWPTGLAAFHDLSRFQFAFLQHGVTTNDLSKWLNPKPIKLFVTASQREFLAISGAESPYVFTTKETELTGFPRHDELLRSGARAAPRTLAILPTWRSFLPKGQSTVDTGGDPEFLNSRFFKEWFALLHHPGLKALAGKHGLQIKFAPHRLVARQLAQMEMPAHVEFVDVQNNFRYQELIAESRLALSDYSSVLTEFAYILRPVVYFQFDREEFFGGQHTLGAGYFDYDQDGFGAVGQGVDEVLGHIEAVLEDREDAEYAQRRKAFFAFRDGRCCERVWQAVQRRSSNETWHGSLARAATGT
jgi:glycosyltransferase involved in cell wall biosynthesis